MNWAAGITLTSEILAKEKRLAATVIAVCGVLAAPPLHCYYSGIGDWRMLYFIGGGLDLRCSFFRIAVAESSMCDTVKKSSVQLGNFLRFFLPAKSGSTGTRWHTHRPPCGTSSASWYPCRPVWEPHGHSRCKSRAMRPCTSTSGWVWEISAPGCSSNAGRAAKPSLFYAVTVLFMILFCAGIIHRWPGSTFCAADWDSAGISVLYITTTSAERSVRNKPGICHLFHHQ